MAHKSLCVSAAWSRSIGYMCLFVTAGKGDVSGGVASLLRGCCFSCGGEAGWPGLVKGVYADWDSVQVRCRFCHVRTSGDTRVFIELLNPG